MGAAAIGCVILSLLLGRVVFGMRGPYFAIGTLGIALAARELDGTWLWIGGGSGIAMQVYPGMPHEKSVVLYVFLFIIAAAAFDCVRWLYATPFGLAIKVIRDDEEQAEMSKETTPELQSTIRISYAFLSLK